jgi:hypothetical protein
MESDPVYPSIRQIAFELDESLGTQLPAFGLAKP